MRPGKLMSLTSQKPGKVQAISIMVLVMGIFATLGGLTLLLSTVCIYFVAIYGIVHGIMAIVRGSQLLGSDPWDAYQGVRTTAIMGIVNIINCDIWGMVCGIVILVFSWRAKCVRTCVYLKDDIATPVTLTTKLKPRTAF